MMLSSSLYIKKPKEALAENGTSAQSCLDKHDFGVWGEHRITGKDDNMVGKGDS
jgi:hypothetical protein